MYGYIRFYGDELKVKDLALFKAYYCGLCRQLKRDYGERSRFLLSYDMTFMAIFLDALKTEAPSRENGFCPANPWRKKNMVVNTQSLAQAALVTVVMSYYKLADAWTDDRTYAAKIAMALYKKAFDKCRRRNPPVTTITEKYLCEFYQGEKQENVDLDTLVHPFAQLVAEIIALNAPEDEKEHFRLLGYHAGRWLYLIDALDDLPADVTKGKFNAFTATLPYTYTHWSDFFDQAAEDIYANLFFSLEEITNIFNSLPIRQNRELIENIFFLGIHSVSDLLFQRRQKGDAEKFAVPFKFRKSCSHQAIIKE